MTAGNQALSIALGTLREDRSIVKIWPHWLREFKVSLPLAFFFTGLSFLLGTFVFEGWIQNSILSVAIGLQILVSVYLGSLTPFLLRKVGLEPIVSSIPVYALFADVFAVILLFGLLRFFFA